MPKIRLPVFEGPLDLLLQLIERDDLDITAVSLVAVTDQYLEAIHTRDGIDARALAEFVAIGARLILLKSRALLPPQPHDDTLNLDDDDVGRELVDLLKEYRRFSEVAAMLDERQASGLRHFTRAVPPPVVPPSGTGLEGLEVGALYRLMVEALARKPHEPTVTVERHAISLDSQVASLRARLRQRGRFSFRTVLEACRTRVEVVVSFLAVLELLKAGECEALQADRWGDIEVVALAQRGVNAG
ncbi:MAG: ScpA family protein [Dehalococcoidia bacterium]